MSGPVKPPLKGCHPTVHALFQHAGEKRMSQAALARRSGVSEMTLTDWKHRCADPRISYLEACLNALGYRLTVEPIPDNDVKGAVLSGASLS